jgi:hypothetical protein
MGRRGREEKKPTVTKAKSGKTGRARTKRADPDDRRWARMIGVDREFRELSQAIARFSSARLERAGAEE